MKQPLLLAMALFFTITLYSAKTSLQTRMQKPCGFTKNTGQFTYDNGQAAEGVLAKASMPGMDVYLTTTGVTYVFMQYEEDHGGKPHPVYFNEQKYKVRYSRVDVELTGATLEAGQMEFSEAAAWKTNYYKQGVQSGTQAMSQYNALTIKHVYPGVDWVWKINAGKLEYDFVVHAGADAGAIKMRYSYADIKPGANNISISATNGTIAEGPLSAASENLPVKVTYVFDKALNEISFNAGEYDHTKDLLIDPPLALQWSAQYGGTFDDGLRGIATDSLGYLYMTGYTNSFDFPTKNAGGTSYFDGSYAGNTDAVVMKVDSGENLIWCTYLGGAGNDFGNSITLDKQGNIYVTGAAETGFPIVNSAGAYSQSTSGGALDVFVAKFNTSLALVWSTFYGGAGNEEGLRVRTDLNDNVYVCGYTNSPSGSFPTYQSAGYYQTSAIGNEAFILEFNSAGKRLWATLYGGSGDDYATSLATDSTGQLVVAGYTTSTDLPVSSAGGSSYYQMNNKGTTNGFILSFDNANNRKAATYYGGSGNDYFTDVTGTINGSFAFTGRTSSSNFPITVAPGFGFNQTTLAGSYDAFIVQCKNDLTPSWSTYYGGGNVDAGTGITTDKEGRMYVTGFTFSTNFPLDSPLYQGAYYQPVNKGNSDGFIAGFSYLGARFWSTYKGDSCYEYPNDIAFSNIYNKFYICGEGLLSCSANLVDTGTLPNGGGSVSSDGFAWAFNGQGSAAAGGDGGEGGDGQGGGGGGGGGGGDGRNSSTGCFTLTASVTPPCPGQCNGLGAASISGALAPVSIIWSDNENGPNASGLCDGQSWVEAQDASGCVAQAVFVPQALTITNISTQPVGCGLDGAATASASGGTPPYSYLWDDYGLTSNSSTLSGIYTVGDYWVTVTDANGCSVASDSYVDWGSYSSGYSIEVIKAPNCYAGGGIIAAFYNGAPATVSWSGNVPDSTSGFYADTIFNVSPGYYFINGAIDCIQGQQQSIFVHFSDSSSVEQDNFIELNTPDTSCLVGTGSIYVNSSDAFFDNTPFTYLWSNNSTGAFIDNLLPGTYDLTITDAIGCSATFSYTLAPADTPSYYFSSSQIVSATCALDTNNSILLPNVSGGGGGPYTFSWSNGDMGCPLYNLPQGNYSVTVTGANGCSATQSGIDVNYVNSGTIAFAATNASCYASSNGSVTANVISDFGGPPYSYSYSWSNGASGNSISNIPAGNYTVTVTAHGGSMLSACVVIGQSSATFKASISTGTFSCSKGNAATAVVQGGKGPYQYYWSDGDTSARIKQAVTGELDLLVKDSQGCTAVDSEQVRSAPPFSASYSADTILCNGDQAKVNVTANGGFPPYSGTGYFLYAAGTYSLTVADSSGCSSNLSVQLTQPTVLVPTYTATPILCNGQQSIVSLSATGGKPPYRGTGNYSEPAGNYTLQVVDANGCVQSIPVPITQPAPLLLNITAQDTVDCLMDSTHLYVEAAGGTYPYTGTGVFAFSEDGPYNVAVTDYNGCMADTTVHVLISKGHILTTSSDGKACLYDQVQLSASNLTTITWYPGFSHEQVYIIDSIPANERIYATGVNDEGCEVADTFNIAVRSCDTALGVISLADDNLMDVFPNPASNSLTIRIQLPLAADGNACLFSTEGQMVWTQPVKEGETTVEADCNMLASGVYILRLKCGDTDSYRRVVIDR